MLPGVNTQNGTELPDYRILVCVRLDLHAPCLRVLDEPGPAAALDASQGRIEPFLEGVEAAVAVVDGFGEGTRGGLAAALAGGGKVLPEKRVVDVAAAVEVDQGLQGNLGGNVVFGLCFGDLLAEVVVRRDVCVVVVLVVQFHDLAADGGLEGAIIVCICWLDDATVGRGDERAGSTWKVGQCGLCSHKRGCDAGAGSFGGGCGSADS